MDKNNLNIQDIQKRIKQSHINLMKWRQILNMTIPILT